MNNFLLLMAPVATDAAGTATNGEATANPYGFLTTLIPIALMIAVFYFFLIRPEKKRKKEISQMRDSLKVGDTIVTIGGIIGKVTNIKDEELTIETASDRNKVRIMRWAISSRETKEATSSEQVAESLDK